MKSTGLLQLDDNLQQAGKVHNLQQVCGVSGCVTDKNLKTLWDWIDLFVKIFKKYKINRDYFMVGECVRFLFTSCEGSLNERVSAANE